MTHHFGICHVYTWYIPDIWYEYTWDSVEQFCMRMVQSEDSLASALQFTHPWHAITALEWIKIHCFSNSIYMVYTMYIPCIYLGLWIYMVYTWIIHGICDHRDSRCPSELEFSSGGGRSFGVARVARFAVYVNVQWVMTPSCFLPMKRCVLDRTSMCRVTNETHGPCLRTAPWLRDLNRIDVSLKQKML